MVRRAAAADADVVRAGVAGALFPELVASAVTLTNSAGVHAVPIAETVLGGVLSLLDRRLRLGVSKRPGGQS